jgi:hypothetical protein
MANYPELAPSWLPRKQRRHVDRALRKLFHRNACSFCGEGFKHNHPSAAGFDAHGNVALVGECCINRIVKIFGMGLELSGEHLAAAYQKAEADRIRDNAERRGGVGRPPEVNFVDSLWKEDDRAWFERNRGRAHRVRMPFPGEANKEAANLSAGQALVMLVRQIEPGARLRAAVFLDANLPPLPDDEATAHALLEAAAGHEPMPRDRQALCALVKKYSARKASR